MKGITVITMGVLLFSSLSAATQKIYHYPQAEALPDDSTTIFPRDPALLTGKTNVNASRRICIFLAYWMQPKENCGVVTTELNLFRSMNT